MMTMEGLLDKTWDVISGGHARPDGEVISVPLVVPCEPELSQSRFSDSFPVLDYLEEAIQLAKAGPLAGLAELFEQAAPGLAWSQNPSYTKANCSEAFLNGYAYAGISGPEGPVHCAAPRGGFMLMAPHIHYPGHHHGPKEVYLVLTPGTQWQLDEGDWFDVKAGDLIYHKPWRMHAMRTGEQPLLAFAGWIDPGDRRSISWSASGSKHK